jgi:hypothetical protein
LTLEAHILALEGQQKASNERIANLEALVADFP